eukprot:2150062-Rhodomonas_salina.1
MTSVPGLHWCVDMDVRGQVMAKTARRRVSSLSRTVDSLLSSRRQQIRPAPPRPRIEHSIHAQAFHA